jgi:hypothetical protein
MLAASLVALVMSVTPPPPPPPTARYVRLLDGDSTRVDVAAHVLPVAGGALVTGWTTSGDAPADAFVARVDGEARVLWRRHYGGAGADILFGLRPDPRGGWVGAGLSTTGTASMDGWIVALDDTGGVRWETRHGGAGADRFTSLAPSGRGWIAAGQVAGPGGTDAWAVRTDSLGRGVGTSWTSGDSLADGALAVETTDDGGCVIVGAAGATREDADGFVRRLAADATTRWTHRFGGAGRQLAYHLSPADSGAFLVTGYGETNDAGGIDALAMLVAADGTVRWQRSLGDTATDRGVHGLLFGDGSAVVLGYAKARAAADDAPVWRTVLHGVRDGSPTTWRTFLGGPGRESGRWIAGTPDDLWVVGQQATAAGGSRVFVARIVLKRDP